MTPRQQDGILWLWSTTELSATAIAKRMNLTRSQVLGYIKRRRDAGDVRAVSRRPIAGPAPTQTLEQRLAQLERLVASMHSEQRRAA